MNCLRGIVYGLLLALIILPFLLMQRNAMPGGTNLASPFCKYENARLLLDQTYGKSAEGGPALSQEIFDTILAEIEGAETFLILDFFLWNNWRGKLDSKQVLRPLSRELFEALKKKRRENPELPILIITDPINRFYGSGDAALAKRWKQAGLSLVFTDLSQLPDSNWIYAPLAQFWGRLLAPLKIGGWVLPLKNPFEAEAPSFSLSQWNRLLHFKANHRKVLISGRRDGETRLLVSSFNPADGSARHSNAGLLVSGPIAHYAARSEIAIARWSGRNPENLLGASPAGHDACLLRLEACLTELAFQDLADAGEAAVAWRSEGAIRESLLEALHSAGTGDRIDLALFYFADRGIIKALRDAAKRGARVRCLLDINKDAFGQKKNGIPNRVVAAELMKDSGVSDISVRWADTRTEQFHSKVLRLSGSKTDLLCLGSANWTRRNLGNLNLEANLLLRECGALGQEWDAYYDALWSNAHNAEASLPYAAHALSGWSLRWKTALYRFQEWTGLSTF
jgi:phosphatidylserine/phosphatidylglycerophosphate/cardiolipin synthase-like enzyme